MHADLSDKSTLATLLEGIDMIVHLSGIPHASASFDELLPNNILAPHLFEAAVAAGVKRLVFVCSAHKLLRRIIRNAHYINPTFNGRCRYVVCRIGLGQTRKKTDHSSHLGDKRHFSALRGKTYSPPRNWPLKRQHRLFISSGL